MASSPRQQYLRRIPAVSALLEAPAVRDLAGRLPRTVLAAAAAGVAETLRREILAAPDEAALAGIALDLDAVAGRVRRRALAQAEPRLRRVVNATGIIVHTNLGRSVLSPAAVDALVRVATAYTNLEFDLESGERGERHEHVADLLRRITGAEAALVVNNNAAAVLLVLSALARGREVVVSRGQLVEIGGAFRIPEVLAQSGATLVEVGTTNKTRLADYEAAVTERTALLLRVHTSNYRIVGFTETVSLPDLVALGEARGLPVVDDLGSGFFVDLAAGGVGDEPTVQQSVAAGAAVVTFSGDKLLGGPQAGIIVGRAELVDRIRRHPLARAVRVDKFTLAALEATLQLYLEAASALAEVPTLRLLTLTEAALAARARRLARRLRRVAADRVAVATEPGVSQVGGGALPTAELPTRLVSLRPRDMSVSRLAARLRAGPVPVLGRVHRDALLLDPRTLLPGDDARVAEALAWALGEGGRERVQ